MEGLKTTKTFSISFDELKEMIERKHNIKVVQLYAQENKDYFIGGSYLEAGEKQDEP